MSVAMSGTRRARRERVMRAALVVATLVLLAKGAVFLLALPAVGMADRGDYYRVARPAGIFVESPRTDELGRPVLRRTYAERRPHLWRGATSASLVALAARHIGIGAPGTFDLRQLGATYLGLAALFVGAALLAGAPPGACLALTWALVDPATLAYMNSFYSEPAAVLSLFGLALWFCVWGRASARLPTHGTRRALLGLAALIGLLAFGGFSRAAMAFLPCLVLVLLFVRWIVPRPRIPRAGVVACLALGTVAIAPPLYFSVGSGPRFARMNSFDAVFQGALAVTDDRAGLLRQLGLPPSAAALAGKSYLDAEPSPELERAVAGVSFGARVWAYAREPVTVLRVARVVAQKLATGDVLPSYETADAAPRDRAQWSIRRLQSAILGAAPSLVWAVFGAMAGVVWMGATGRIDPVIPPDVVALLATVSFTQLVIAVAGDGMFSLGRHLAVARYTFDSAAALMLFEGAVRVARRAARRIADPVELDDGARP